MLTIFYGQMHRWCCRDHANYYMSKLQFNKYALLSRQGFFWEYALLSQNGFRCKYAPFWVCLVQTFTQTFRIWLRFCADIWTKNRRLAALFGVISSVRSFFFTMGEGLTFGRHIDHPILYKVCWINDALKTMHNDSLFKAGVQPCLPCGWMDGSTGGYWIWCTRYQGKGQ